MPIRNIKVRFSTISPIRKQLCTLRLSVGFTVVREELPGNPGVLAVGVLCFGFRVYCKGELI